MSVADRPRGLSTPDFADWTPGTARVPAAPAGRKTMNLGRWKSWIWIVCVLAVAAVIGFELRGSTGLGAALAGGAFGGVLVLLHSVLTRRANAAAGSKSVRLLLAGTMVPIALVIGAVFVLKGLWPAGTEPFVFTAVPLYCGCRLLEAFEMTKPPRVRAPSELPREEDGPVANEPGPRLETSRRI